MKNKHWIILLTLTLFSLISGESFALEPERQGLFLDVGGSFAMGRGTIVYDPSDFETRYLYSRWAPNGGLSAGLGYAFSGNLKMTGLAYWTVQSKRDIDSGKFSKTRSNHIFDLLVGAESNVGGVVLHAQSGYSSLLGYKQDGTSGYYPGWKFRFSLGYEIPLDNMGIGITGFYSHGFYYISKTEGGRYVNIGLELYFRLY